MTLRMLEFTPRDLTVSRTLHSPADHGRPGERYNPRAAGRPVKGSKPLRLALAGKADPVTNSAQGKGARTITGLVRRAGAGCPGGSVLIDPPADSYVTGLPLDPAVSSTPRLMHARSSTC